MILVTTIKSSFTKNTTPLIRIKNYGYCPGISGIGKTIIHIENRGGNANVKTEQAETLKRAYQSVSDIVLLLAQRHKIF